MEESEFKFTPQPYAVFHRDGKKLTITNISFASEDEAYAFVNENVDDEIEDITFIEEDGVIIEIIINDGESIFDEDETSEEEVSEEPAVVADNYTETEETSVSAETAEETEEVVETEEAVETEAVPKAPAEKSEDEEETPNKSLYCRDCKPEDFADGPVED